MVSIKCLFATSLQLAHLLGSRSIFNYKRTTLGPVKAITPRIRTLIAGRWLLREGGRHQQRFEPRSHEGRLLRPDQQRQEHPHQLLAW